MHPQEILTTEHLRKAERFEHPQYTDAFRVHPHPGTQGNHPDTGAPIDCFGFVCPKCKAGVAANECPGTVQHVCGAFIQLELPEGMDLAAYRKHLDQKLKPAAEPPASVA